MSIVTSRGYSMEGKTVVMTGTSPGTIGHGGAMAVAKDVLLEQGDEDLAARARHVLLEGGKRVGEAERRRGVCSDGG